MFGLVKRFFVKSKVSLFSTVSYLSSVWPALLKVAHASININRIPNERFVIFIQGSVLLRDDLQKNKE